MVEQGFEINSELLEKEAGLKEYIGKLGSLAVAFSGGVDSTYLLKIAHEVLGDKVAAVTAISASFPKSETEEAADFCKREGIRQLTVMTNELELEGFKENPPERCYICKTGIFTALKNIANEEGLAYVADGSNIDDLGDYRPGLKALHELGIKSPLQESGMSKEDVRKLSKLHGLTTWSKPSAACLSSRFSYGELITKEKLKMVEQAENILKAYGFMQLRVRMHGENLARIEVVKDEFLRLLELGPDITERLKELGFVYVTMDLLGYRVGSMNEVL